MKALSKPAYCSKKSERAVVQDPCESFADDPVTMSDRHASVVQIGKSLAMDCEVKLDQYHAHAAIEHCLYMFYIHCPFGNGYVESGKRGYD